VGAGSESDCSVDPLRRSLRAVEGEGGVGDKSLKTTSKGKADAVSISKDRACSSRRSAVVRAVCVCACVWLGRERERERGREEKESASVFVSLLCRRCGCWHVWSQEV
jgi:hypothetical protein